MNKKHIAPLFYQCKEIILGSLLGDGSLKIYKPYQNARFSFRHAKKQEDYFLWKVSKLKEISSNNCFWEQQKNGRDGWGYTKLRYQSQALEALTELHKLTHKGGKKKIRRKWLNQLTPLSLAVWWCDDGSLVGNTRKGVFCTDSFSLEEIKILRKYLRIVWDIETNLGTIKTKSGKNCYRLWITSTQQLKKFLQIILPEIPTENMLQKATILYKDSQLQERWISEVEKLSPFSRSAIDKQVALKKSKWKAFRE